MSWTYSGNPGYSAKDQVRFLIGDTSAKDPLLLDGEIDWLLSQYQNNAIAAAIRGCETIMTKFSRMSDESVGQVKISFSQKAKAYQTLVNQLRQRISIEDMTPFAGGISHAQKREEEANTDRVKPDFTKQMMDNKEYGPGLPSQGGLLEWAPNDDGNGD